MKSKCEGCTNYRATKRLPDYQVTFNNWCDLNQTPSALIRNCDYFPDSIKQLPKTKVEERLDEFFNIFAKKKQSNFPLFQPPI
ncbi:MAG: hypothetical protein EU536_04090 [Promethearchaeota archaeon]|nr:MAG: hypothetical protein EU536_04090 [Candidatus Lokiarchaeota archaeon]